MPSATIAIHYFFMVNKKLSVCIEQPTLTTYTTQVVPMIYGSGWLKIIFEENQAHRQVVLSQQKKRDQFVFWLGRNFSKVYLLKCKSHILSLMVLGMLKSSQFYFLQRLRQESLRFIYFSFWTFSLFFKEIVDSLSDPISLGLNKTNVKHRYY